MFCGTYQLVGHKAIGLLFTLYSPTLIEHLGDGGKVIAA